jgi:hypothetical protein
MGKNYLHDEDFYNYLVTKIKEEAEQFDWETALKRAQEHFLQEGYSEEEIRHCFRHANFDMLIDYLLAFELGWPTTKDTTAGEVKLSWNFLYPFNSKNPYHRFSRYHPRVKVINSSLWIEKLVRKNFHGIRLPIFVAVDGTEYFAHPKILEDWEEVDYVEPGTVPIAFPLEREDPPFAQEVLRYPPKILKVLLAKAI